MNIFVSGGAKNGKSHFAQTAAKEMAETYKVPLYYVATMIPVDDEDRIRIKRHIAEREGWGFTTIEQGINILEIFDRTEPQKIDKNGVFLLDSVTALLDNEMFSPYNSDAAEKVAEELVELARLTGKTIFVSDYIYGDPGPFDEYTENYRKGLAHIDRRLADICNQVYEVTAGIPICRK